MGFIDNSLRLKLVFLISAILASLKPDTLQSLHRCDVLLVCHDINRGYTYHNQAYDPLLDSLGDLFQKKSLITQSVAKPFSRLAGSCAYGKPVAFNRANLYIALKSRVISLFQGRKQGDDWADKQREKLWWNILDCSQPRVVIGIQPDPALCRACHAQAVPVYDLQHGAIGDEHTLYGIEFREKTDSHDLPHGFLCWDKPSTQALEKWAPRKGIAIHIVGNPWFSRFLEDDADDILVKETLEIQPLLGNERPTILISLSYGMATIVENISSDVMPYALEQTILETANFYNWLIRLHPVQIRGSESSMVQNYLAQTFGHLRFVEWRQCSDVPLPVVLQWSDLHITYCSTITTEAAWMGLYTGLLHPDIRPGKWLSTLFEYERSLGIAETLSLDSRAIELWIKSTLKKGKARSTFVVNKVNLEAFITEIKSRCI